MLAKATEDQAATAMQAAVRGRGAHTAAAAKAEAATESYINEVVSEVLSSAIDKATAPEPKKPGLLTRMSTSLFSKKDKKAEPVEAKAEVEAEKRKGSSSSLAPSDKKKSKTTKVEEPQQPVVKFGFEVGEGGEVSIQMELEKAAATPLAA